jgi:hypothetical protein
MCVGGALELCSRCVAARRRLSSCDFRVLPPVLPSSLRRRCVPCIGSTPGSKAFRTLQTIV